MSRLSKITDKDFSEVVKNNYYMVDILEGLGYSRTSGTMTKYIKKRANKLKISLDHLNKGRGGKQGVSNYRYTLEEILIKDSPYTNQTRLKIRLLREGKLDEICAICGCPPKWQGKKLSLHLDHINGINNDNRLENLRILCPNCHSQTDTYGSKNATSEQTAKRQKRKSRIEHRERIDNKIAERERLKPLIKQRIKTVYVKNCRCCKNSFNTSDEEAKYCSRECFDFSRRVVERPSKEVLYNLLVKNSFLEVGRLYNVSDNAIRKWCQFYELPTKSSYYKNFNK